MNMTKLIIAFSSSEKFSRPDKPLSLRVTTDKETLSISLPGVLNPSMAGLGEMVGIPRSYEYFSQTLGKMPQTENQSIRLYIEEYGDDDEDTVIYWNAGASSVFQSIWDEVERICVEKNLKVESVELR